jgi:hypothetical protein
MVPAFLGLTVGEHVCIPKDMVKKILDWFEAGFVVK